MPNLGPTELIIVLVIVLLLFGGAKLPQLAKGLGEGIREFKRSSKEQPDEAQLPPPTTPAPGPEAPKDNAS